MVFGSGSSLRPLISGAVDWCASLLVIKADPLGYFDSKQSRESVDLQLTCNPSPSLTTFSFRSSEVWRLLLDLTLVVALTHLVCFLFFLRELLMSCPLVLM